jgi:hypothetical protein
MLGRLARPVLIVAVALSPLLLAGSAGAVINNGGGPSSSNTAKVCNARWHACYKHCDGWYKGDAGKINDCKTRTCDYQFAACNGW